MTRHFFTRLIVMVLATSILAPSFLLIAPEKTYAAGVGCVGGLIGGLGSTLADVATAVPVYSKSGNIINSSTAGSTLGSCVYDAIIVPLIRLAIRAIIQQMTASVISWINGTPGPNGTKSPSYVFNLSLNLQNLSDSVALPIIAQMASSFNSPFGPAISSALRLNYTQSTSLAGFYAANQCTLSRYSPNINSFLAGNWSQGGVAAWLALTTNPANNPYMLYQSASAQVNGAVALAQTNRRQDLLQSSGFLSWCGAGSSTTSSSGNPPACTKASDCPNGYSCVAGACELGSGSSNSSAITTKDACTNSDGTPGKVMTPGSVIHDYTQSFVVNAGLQQLVSANDLDSAFNAIIMALLNQVLGGAGGLFGASSPSNGGTPLTSQLQNYQGASSNASQNAAQTAQNVLANYTAYTNAWNTVIAAARSALTNLNALSNSCSTNSTVSQQTSAATATINQILSQANAAIQSVQATQTLALKVQSEGSATSVSSTFQQDLLTLVSMPPTPSDLANAQSAATPTGAATANPAGSLNISGGSLIDQINLINKNAQQLQSNGCVVSSSI